MKIQLSDHFTYSRLIRFTLPSMAMMIFTSIYGVVDGFFVSNFVGKTAFAAVNLIMPFLMITATVGFMLGTGGTAIVARALGEGRKEYANRCFSLFVYTALVLGVVIAVLGFVFIRPISAMLGASGQLLDDCAVYGRINLLALPFYILQLLFQTFFPAAEKPQLGFGVTVASGLTNMVLDAVLVPLLPAPYKLMGAAAATALSQVVGGAIPLFYFLRPNKSLLRLGRTRFDGKTLRKACINGSSEFMSNVAMSVVSILYNWQLILYAGENGIAAYGVMMYVSFIFAAAFIGYSMGVGPIVSFHDGARNLSELHSLLRKSLILNGAGGAVMLLAAQLLATPLARVFVGYDAELMALTVSGFRIYALSFVFMGFGIFASGFFTALNDGLTSALISFMRTLVLEVAAVLILPLLFGITGVWASIVAAQALATVLAAIFLRIKQPRYGY